jgi:2-iminobutanoate/2-iminopropanoate deaminase
MAFEVIRGKDVPATSLPFSSATKAGGFVYVSGQASVDETGKIIGDTFENECRRSFDNVGKVLAAAGLDFSHVVRTGCYVRDPGDLTKFNEIYREYFKEPYPARTTITDCLPEIIKFEVDVVAYAG